jgi:hypothetical protein
MADENILDTRPKGTFTAIFTPPWWVDMASAKNGSILQVHHPEHGWLAFVFPPDHAALSAIDGDCELTFHAYSTAHCRAPVCFLRSQFSF